MELSDYLRILRKRWTSVALVFVVLVGAALAVTALMPARFSAATRMYVAPASGESIADLNQGSNFTERQMATYTEVAVSPFVLGPVMEQLQLGTGLEQFAEQLDVTVPLDTFVLQIEATDRDPATAAEIANAVATQLTAAITTLSPGTSGDSQSVRATVLSHAVAPSRPSVPDGRLNLALGAMAGLALGVGAAFLREATDTKIRNEGELAEATCTNVLGALPRTPSGGAMYMSDDPFGAPAENMRRIRTNLQFIGHAERVSSIVVTSTIAGEGKSTTAINLALALADSGLRVVLVDADMRRPSIADVMGLEGGAGLSTVLIGRAELEDVVQPWRDCPLDVLTSGQIPPNPSELLGSRAMAALVEQLTRSYEAVVLDSPPLLPVTDAAVLSRVASGTLVVVDARRARKPQVREALTALETVRARVLGAVLNNAPSSGASHRYRYRTPDSPRRTTAGARPAVRRADDRRAQAAEVGT